MLSLFRRAFGATPARVSPPLEVIGPAPWYFRERRWARGSSRFSWALYGKEYGPMGLYQDDSPDPLLLLAIYSYCAQLPDGDLVAWHPHPTEEGQGRPATHLAFRHFSIASLRPFKPSKRGEQLAEDRTEWAWTAQAPSAQWLLPVGLAPGEHSVAIPQWLSPFNELLVLIDQTAEGGRAIAALHPRVGRVTILPLTWFNTGNYDFGYEWVTRVARHPSGDIVGDGFRINAFRLDATGGTLKEWLQRSPIP